MSIDQDLARIWSILDKLRSQDQPRWKWLQTPLTSASWTGASAKTVADNGIIDLSAVFGVPAGVKAVALSLGVVGNTVPTYAQLGPNAGYYTAVFQSVQVSGVAIYNSGIVPCDANGDIYFRCTGNLTGVEIIIGGYQF